MVSTYIAGMSWEKLFGMCRIFEFLKYYVISIYFQAAVFAILAVSVLYVGKNENEYYVIFQKFESLAHIK